MTKKVQGRHGSRWMALQGLYAYLLSGVSLSQIEEDLLLGLPFAPEDKFLDKISFDKNYLNELLHAIGARRGNLDEVITPYLDRPLEEINPVEHAILWIATYELQERLEIPYKVIINEAILLAKQFGAQDSHKFINGVLDRAAKNLRPHEVPA
jgi:N utilization substance protein B